MTESGAVQRVAFVALALAVGATDDELPALAEVVMATASEVPDDLGELVGTMRHALGVVRGQAT